VIFRGLEAIEPSNMVLSGPSIRIFTVLVFKLLPPWPAG